MIENRHFVSASVEPLQTVGQSLCIDPALSERPVQVCGKRILLAEDQEPLRECLRMLLEQEGHQVSAAGNGSEALRLFASGEFDVVITDFDMPVMGGNRLAVSIKSLAPLLPILMITGSGSIQRDSTNPVDALLNKPFTATDLLWALAELLANGPEPAQPSVAPLMDPPPVTCAPESRSVACAAA